MTLWQYNAYSEGHMIRQRDALALQVQAAYYNAYWNGEAKHKKSLQQVLDRIYQGVFKKKKDKPIDVAALEKEFTAMEELRDNGWTKQ